MGVAFDRDGRVNQADEDLIGENMLKKRTSENLLTAKQVSDFLNIHPQTLQRWCKEGKIQSLRASPRGRLWFMGEDVLRYLDELNGPGKRLPIHIRNITLQD
jgi:hypothetical protein